MNAKKMYQEPKMRMVEVDNTAMICQSPGGFDPSAEIPGGNEEE